MSSTVGSVITDVISLTGNSLITFAMPYKRVRPYDGSSRILSLLFIAALLFVLTLSQSVFASLAAVVVVAVVVVLAWWVDHRITTMRIAKATNQWRSTYYPDETSPAFIRFVESLGADLGGHFDNLTPQTPLAEMDWTTLEPKLRMDLETPCKRWIDFVLNHANINGVETRNLGDKTLEHLVDLVIQTDVA